jgi:PAS domain S-box-containing protein
LCEKERQVTDERKTKAQLSAETTELRRRVRELERIEKDPGRKLEELSESEARYRSASGLVTDQVFRVIPDAQGKPRIEPLLGEVGRISGHAKDLGEYPYQWKEILHRDDWRKVEDFLEAVRRGEKRELQLRIERPDGGIRWVDVVGMPESAGEAPGSKGILCCVKDVTRERLMEEEGKRKAAYFRSSVENMLDSFGIFRPVRGEKGEIDDFTVEYLNPAAVRHSPLTEEDVLGRGIAGAMQDDRGQELFRKLCRVVETGRPILREMFAFEDIHEGKPRSRIFDLSVSKLGEDICAVWRDVTDLKRAERETRLVRERLEFLVSGTPAVIYTAKPSGDYAATFVSKNVEQLMGYKPDEFVNHPRFWIDHVHPDDRERVLAEVPSVFETEPYTYEYRFRYKDGRYAWVSDEIKVVRDHDGNPLEIVGYWTDVTDRKNTEQELIRLERLRALGQMAAGVSHNLNNLLTTILGPAKLLQQEIDDPELLRETEFILTSARRARDLVRRLNEAVRGGSEGGLGPVSADKVVGEAVDITRPMWKDEAEGRNIAIEVATDLGEAPPIRGTHSGLIDIVMNLILNSVDAMPRGGRITIRTRAEGDGLMLTVSDTGHGMDEGTLDRVFEPFFSTKTGIGTGLGLSTVYGIVSRWGGSVDVESTPGEGTKFSIRLPCWTGPEAAEDVSEGASRARQAKILIVEDVEPICGLLSRVLSGSHVVDVVLSGREALEKFAPGQYDVAIIDLGLAGITGDRVGRLMRQTDASLATILISGWDIEDGDPRIAPFDFWLEKPFDDLKQVEAVVAKAVELHDSRSKGRTA